MSPDLPFRLSDAAMRVGDRHVEWRVASYPHAALATFLSQWIYREQTLTALLRPAWWSGIVVLAIGLLVAVPADAARARDRRQGRRLKGPELVSPARFNRRLRGDGLMLRPTPAPDSAARAP